jgi:cytochrome c oxidase subunit 2
MLIHFLKCFYTFILNNDTVFLDAAQPWQLGFQDPATPIMEGIIEFHNHLMFFITLIAVFISWLLFTSLFYYYEEFQAKSEMFTHNIYLEIVWTIVPALILLVIAIPSFALLYSIDEMIDPSLTLKVIGHQWYWSYEYSDFKVFEDCELRHGIRFDSYMIPLDELGLGNLRLLEVDHRIILPVNTHIRVLVTAADVLHSWAIPSFGLKVDACPGRLNQTSLFIKRSGVYFGQCSEICGVNHGFMPIAIKAIDLHDYLYWLNFKFKNHHE